MSIVDMINNKVVALDVIYNFEVDRSFNWSQLES